MTVPAQRLLESLPQAAPAPLRRVVAFTQDIPLTQSLEALTDTGVDVELADSADGFAEALLLHPGCVGLLDAAALGSSLGALIDVLGQQFPDTRFLVAGNSADQAQLATRIASQRVFRFVHKPASAQRLKLFVDAASGTTQTVEVLSLPGALSRGESTGGIGRKPLLMAVAAALALVLAVGGVRLLQRPSSPVPAAASPRATTSPSGVDVWVQRADQAFALSRFIAQDGSSAAELYARALAIAADDSRARSGLSRSIDYGLRDIETALTAGKLDEAAAGLAALQGLAPRNTRVEFLLSRLARERSFTASEAAHPVASPLAVPDVLPAPSPAAAAAPAPTAASPLIPAPTLASISAPSPEATSPVLPLIAADSVSASTLTVLRRVDPAFPPRALEKGLSGWVDLAFTVALDGSVGDVQVRAAEPLGVFDAAATRAIQRWRFAPVQKEGKPVTQRAVLRLRFTAESP